MPNRSITIQGITFEVEDKYADGATINANEANALNQTRAENLRNNFASEIKDLKEESAKAAGVDADAYELSEDEVQKLRDAFTTYTNEYEFGTRSGGGRVVDPVQREALRLGKEAVEAAIKAKHGKLDAVPKDNIRELIEGYASRDEVQTLARENIERAKNLAVTLDL